MKGDNDLKSILPEGPPPAPKRRETAIAEALTRFDGAPAPRGEPRPARAPRWANLRRPQAGLLATAALVATISLPFAWTTLDPAVPAADERASRPTGTDARIVARDAGEAAAPVAVAAPPDTEAVGADARAPAPSLAVASPSTRQVGSTQTETAAPAAKAEQSTPIVVAAQRVARPVLDSPSAVTVISSDDAAGDSVVVTGSRIVSRDAPRRGDWNACTVNDPSRTVSRCRKLADKGAKAARAEADAHLSDGLKQAWKGDFDGAISAFDQAIAAAPDLSVAYLNRGLAYDRQGDDERAMADLDRAVRHAPQSARAYYNRSLLLRKQGETRRANIDEQRAINLDARYQAVRQRERD